MIADLRAEMRTAAASLEAADLAALIDLGIDPRELDRFRMCGVARVSVSRGLYAPSPGGAAAIITPVRVYSAASPEAPRPRIFTQWGKIVDLVAWHPAEPAQWALRIGAAEWLGCIEPQYLDPDPVPVHRSVLDWLRAGRIGLVLLSRDPADQYRVLSLCRGGIIAADKEHFQELRRVLSRPWQHPSLRCADVAA